MDYSAHPWMSVECFGCGDDFLMAKTADGRAELPPDWVTLAGIDHSGNRMPDVYCSPPCVAHGAQRVAACGALKVIVLPRPIAEFIEVRLTV